MRESNRQFIQKKIVEEIVTASKEDLKVVNKNKEDKVIDIIVAFKDSSGSLLGEENLFITGDHYELLMSENPEFAPNKPLNDFREDDLWYIIDMIRNGQ